MRNDRLDFQVTNNNMGGDPAPATPKQLRLRYQYNGRDYDVTARENDWVRLPDGVSGSILGGTGGYQSSSGLYIERAEYGEGNKINNVTQRLQSMVQSDRLSLKVTNQNMGGDPAVGADKRLTVVYRWNGAHVSGHRERGKDAHDSQRERSAVAVSQRFDMNASHLFDGARHGFRKALQPGFGDQE